MFTGCQRKTAALTLEFVFGVICSIPCDEHVESGAVGLEWTDCKIGSAELIGREAEGWLPRHLWKHVNPTFAGLRQLCREAPPEFRSLMEQEGLRLGIWEDDIWPILKPRKKRSTNKRIKKKQAKHRKRN